MLEFVYSLILHFNVRISFFIVFVTGCSVRRNAFHPFELEFRFTIILGIAITVNGEHWKEIEEQAALLIRTTKREFRLIFCFLFFVLYNHLSKMLKWQGQIHYVDSTMNLIHFLLFLLLLLLLISMPLLYTYVFSFILFEYILVWIPST